MTIKTYRDAWGIPHLRAAETRELARAQGRVTAHDRARQLEVERHRAQGTSASFLGSPAVAWDVFARRARLADTARRCFQALERRDPETVSECHDVRPGDIGIHVLLAPAGPQGPRSGWTDALFSVFTEFALRTLDRHRVVVDPDVRNEKAIARFVRQGFTPGPAVVLPEIDLRDVHLPEKRAQLAFLPRAVAFPDADPR
ncbi:GNAT family N-acetyltransferase [Streptomyces sp. NPDC048417]|uniref:GNAT family N-acetyltransferase n=1 Tax=Streptomyces sp. NPDC048417 TaxID=3155387 RepID=UPI003421886E